MMINMRNWKLRKLFQTVFFAIIAGISIILLLINTGETMSNFVPLPSERADPQLKRVNRQIPEFKDFRETIPIRLAAGEFDPLIQAKPDQMTIEFSIQKYPERQEKYYIVQFDGPIKDSQKYELEDLGAHVFDYLPDFSFIVKMDDTVYEMVKSMLSVRWIGFYQPAFRIAPTITEALSSGHRLAGAEYIVTLFKGEDPQAVVQQIEQLGGEILDLSRHGSRGKLKIRLNAQGPELVTAIGGVKWIEAAPVWKLSNNVAAGIVDAYDVWNTHHLYGAGQTVAVADTGLDQGSPSPANLHDDFEDGSGISRVIQIFDRVGDGADDVRSGHGTHVAGSVLGNGDLSGSNPAASDYSNSSSYIGMAPEASLVFQAVENNTTGALSGIPNNLNTLFNQAFGAGASIHTNSWGASVYGSYTSFSANVDQFVWDNPTFLILFAAGNDGVDADRDGVIDLNSMQMPATAKNCISVGATENNRPSGSLPMPVIDKDWDFYWPNDYPSAPIAGDHVSDDEDGMAAFSSRGPCLDGRIKPDIVAPGTNIISTKSTATTQTLWGQGPDLSGSDYTFSGGTSMSTPLVAGAATLVREFYTDLEAITPSAALIKATLLNGAFSITPGQYGTGASQEIPDPPRPNYVEGWGRLDLENSIFPVFPRVFKYYDEVGGLTTNESVAYDFQINNASEPLKATLVWSDYPGSPAAGGGLVNDLDFSIIGPSGTPYYPNNASQNGETEVTSYDRINNVVGIDIGNPAVDSYSINVEGYNVPQGPQPYALVVSGGNLLNWTKRFPPISPKDVTASADLSAGLTDIELTWSDRSNNEDNFIIEKKTGTGGTYSHLATVGANTINYSDPNWNEETVYYYRVRAYSVDINEGDSSYYNEARVAIHAAPTDLSAAAVSDSRINLIWTDNSSIESGYAIWRKLGEGGTYSQVATVEAESYADRNLSASTSYYYKVRAISSNSSSDFSNEADATTLEASTSSSGGGGGGGGCFIAVSGSMVSMTKEIMGALLILGFGMIGLGGLQRWFRNPHE